MMPQQYCLRWKHHHSNVQSMFSQLLEKERFCDVTLYCSPSFGAQLPENGGTVEPDHIKGVSLRAHRVVLAACSELLAALLGAHEAQGEPVVVIDGAEPRHVRALLDYMYTGEMNVHHSQLASLLKTAEDLRIKGLSDIRWNNKDEPPDCQTGSVTAIKSESDRLASKRDSEDDSRSGEKSTINGGPPPLIKLPSKDKCSPNRKRDGPTDIEGSPKRQRMASGTDHTDDDERDSEWQHGNLDITAERVVQWGASEREASVGSWERNDEVSDDEWADGPADIGSFLHTKLRVDGDNTGDEDSGEESVTSASKVGAVKPMSHLPKLLPKPAAVNPSKSGSGDPRFSDVIKLNEYLLHGRRPQFWEEEYVKRVMEAVRLKELEMKQAAEILGVSYGTLYGRYRDVYGCINRPYRNARDFWAAKGPSEILERLQRGDVTLEVAAQALGVTSSHLAGYVADITLPIVGGHEDPGGNTDLGAHFGKMTSEFEPIPIEIDPSLRMKNYSSCHPSKGGKRNTTADTKGGKRGLNDEDIVPEKTASNSSKWPNIRVASLDSLRGGSSTASDPPTPTQTPTPTLLMKTRPDLTIVAAKRTDPKDENGT